MERKLWQLYFPGVEKEAREGFVLVKVLADDTDKCCNLKEVQFFLHF